MSIFKAKAGFDIYHVDVQMNIQAQMAMCIGYSNRDYKVYCHHCDQCGHYGTIKGYGLVMLNRENENIGYREPNIGYSIV
jgi:hypothetical protein